MFASLFLVLLFVLFILFLRAHKKRVTILFTISAIIHCLAFLVFCFLLLIHSSEFNVAIDPIGGDGYTPFGLHHKISLLVWFVLYIASKYLLWYRQVSLPPLTWVLANSIIGIGIVIWVVIILQTTKYTLNYNPNDPYLTPPSEFEPSIFIIYPLFSILSSLYLLTQGFNKVSKKFETYKYKNSFLQKTHILTSKINNYPVVVVVLMLPVFLILTAILMLLGQDYDSMIKVFTDTTTWRFSQQEHPPFLDHKGHYLCTVAAKGSPNLVKPIRLGTRHGHTIIVNRQLQIANAFEAVLEKHLPKTHKYIRHVYDTYGYNLSKSINTPKASNLTYILMKPLEWLFLVVIYTCVSEPEILIKRQYSNSL